MLTIDVDDWLHLDPEVRDEFDQWLDDVGLRTEARGILQLTLVGEGVVKLRVLLDDLDAVLWSECAGCCDHGHNPVYPRSPHVAFIGSTEYRTVRTLPPQAALRPLHLREPRDRHQGLEVPRDSHHLERPPRSARAITSPPASTPR